MSTEEKIKMLEKKLKRIKKYIEEDYNEIPGADKEFLLEIIDKK